MGNDRRWMFAALALAVGSAGCGPELLGGAQREGEVRAVATSEEGADASRAQYFGAGPSASRAGEAAAGVEGELSVTAAVWLVDEDGSLVPVSRGPVPATFTVEGDDQALLGRADVEARSYRAVRVEFTGVSMIVEGGLIVQGQPIIGLVSVNLGSSGSVVVERPVQLTVEARTSRTIVVDLDAHEWLPATVLPSRTVSSAAFAAAVDIHLR